MLINANWDEFMVYDFPLIEHSVAMKMEIRENTINKQREQCSWNHILSDKIEYQTVVLGLRCKSLFCCLSIYVMCIAFHIHYRSKFLMQQPHFTQNTIFRVKFFFISYRLRTIRIGKLCRKNMRSFKRKLQGTRYLKRRPEKWYFVFEAVSVSRLFNGSVYVVSFVSHNIDTISLFPSQYKCDVLVLHFFSENALQCQEWIIVENWFNEIKSIWYEH